MRLLVALIALLLAAPALAAPPRVEVSAPLLQMARPQAWLPVYVDIATTTPVQGTVSVRFAGGDDEHPARRAFEVAKNGRRRIEIAKRVPAWGYELEVSVRDHRGRELKDVSLEVRGGAMSPEAFRVVVIGDDPLGWPTLQEVSGASILGHPQPAQSGFRPVLVENLLPPDLPASWFAWSSVDLLVWTRPDPAALTPEQQQALSGWVASGGTLMVSLADDHGRWSASPLADLVPARAVGLVMSPSARDVLRTLAGNRGALPEGEPVPIVDLAPFPGTDTLLADDSGKPLLLRRDVGAGQVVLAGFDPSAAELSGRVDRELLWRNLFGLWVPASRLGEDATFEEIAAASDPRGFGLVPPAWPVVNRCTAREGYLDIDAAGDVLVDSTWLSAWLDAGTWWQQVREKLVHFEGAVPLSLTFILTFGLLYLLVIGPLDFLVLRRLAKPMWTWVTFPVLAIAFSIGAGVIVRAQKGSDSELRCYEVHDVVAEAGLARRTAWCSLWAGRRGDVTLRPAKGLGFVVPAVGSDYDEESWYGGTDEAINGDDLQTRQSPGTVGLDFESAQWSASTFRGAWQAPSDASARWFAGDEGPVVESRLAVSLTDAVVLHGDRWWKVGDLPAGERRAAIPRDERPGLSAEDLEPAWSLLIDPVEDFGGHIHPGATRPILLGFARGAPGIELGGLRASTDSITLVRVPLDPLTEASP